MAAPDARPDLTDVVIRMAGVAVRRGRATLLADVDWAVELDERWVVLGPNGAGKTTLLRLAGAEMHPTVGTVEVLGERLGRVNLVELRTRIGLSSANLGLRVPGETLVPEAGLRVDVRIAPGVLKPAPSLPGALPAEGSLSRAAVGRKRLYVRSWRPGDRMRPLGLSGSKKLQDIFFANLNAEVEDKHGWLTFVK